MLKQYVLTKALLYDILNVVISGKAVRAQETCQYGILQI
jgi:hypothetical protein